MPLGFLISAIAVSVLICAAHSLAVFSKRGSVLFVIFGILLHAALFPILFFGGAELEVVSLVMMLSVLVYSALSFIKYSVSRARERSGEDDV